MLRNVGTKSGTWDGIGEYILSRELTLNQLYFPWLSAYYYVCSLSPSSFSPGRLISILFPVFIAVWGKGMSSTASTNIHLLDSQCFINNSLRSLSGISLTWVGVHKLDIFVVWPSLLTKMNLKFHGDPYIATKENFCVKDNCSIILSISIQTHSSSTSKVIFVHCTNDYREPLMR